MSDEDRWTKLEHVIRRVLREELAQIGKKPKIDLVAGKWVGINEEQREAWLAAYGAVDLDSELRRAAAWCVSNPTMAPKSNYGRFLNTWLTRQQNQASLRSIPTERPTETKAKLCAYCANASEGVVNGIQYCGLHSKDAMDMRPRKMLGVVPRPVAGND